MKISMQEVGRILQTQSVSGYDNRPSGNAAGVTGAGYAPAAEVEISANAQVVRQAASYVEDAPDVREDVVQALKAQVDNGTYNVPSEDIADLMIRRALADSLR